MKKYSQPLAIAVVLSMVLGGVSSVFAQESPTLTVTLSPDPSSGQAPLSGVDLNVVVGGTATGPIDYTFYCDRADNGTNLTGTPATTTIGASATTMNANDACSYPNAGTYSGKVIVSRGGISAEARATITVTAAPDPTLSVSLVATPSAGQAPLSGVDLSATVSGTASGPINYTFYCDRSDNGTNLVGTPATTTTGASATTMNATDACTYSLPGTYSAKVIAERQSIFSEARATVTVTEAPATPTLSVVLSATPATGSAPLSGVDLSATVSGTASGPINYTFYCDRSDNGTNLVGTPATTTTGASATTMNAVDACSYATAGAYTSKVIVERQGIFAEARATVTATQQPVTPPSTTTPPIMQKGEWKLEIGPAGRALMRGHIETVSPNSIAIRTWGGVWTVRVLPGAEIIPRIGAQLFDLGRFQPGDFVGVSGTIVRDQPLTIEARVIRNWTVQREVKIEKKLNHEFLKRLIKDDKISDSLTGRVFEGTVGSISGTSFTLSDRGVATTIETNNTTRFVDRNYATISFADIQVGHRVRVFGNVTSSSSILAEVARDTTLPISTPSLSSGSLQKNVFSTNGNQGKGKSDDKGKNKGKGNGRDD